MIASHAHIRVACASIPSTHTPFAIRCTWRLGNLICSRTPTGTLLLVETLSVGVVGESGGIRGSPRSHPCHGPQSAYLSVQPNHSRRQARWSEFLSRFHFEFKYRPGATNPADSLSRLYNNAEAASLMVLAVTVSEFSSNLLARIKTESLLDPHFQDDKATRTYTKQGSYWTRAGMARGFTVTSVHACAHDDGDHAWRVPFQS